MELTLSAGGKLTPFLGIPYTYVDAAIPVGCLFMLIYYVQFLWQDINGTGRKCGIEEQR
jgi:TRAP-type C4-dicarboxylate transport system permease small subunit